MTRYKKIYSLLSACLVVCFASCHAHPVNPETTNVTSAINNRTLTLATTTSTRDSGLLDDLLPRFTSESGIKVKVVAVGTGAALEMGRRGDADLLITHAPEAERAFVESGFASKRIPWIYNDFVVVGPAADPAGLATAGDLASGMQRIAQAQAAFVSRGDNSGTHMKEQRLWADAQLTPGSWRLESGSGMAATLRIASEKQAYLLSDRATYLAQRRHTELQVLYEGDKSLRNPYALLLLNPAKFPHLDQQAAQLLVDFLLRGDIQEKIAEFGIDQFEQPLFYRFGDGRAAD